MHTRMSRLWPAMAAVVGILLANSAAGEPFVPPELREWIPWIEEAHPEWACARSGDNEAPICTWPTIAQVSANGSQVEITLKVRSDASGWLALPGLGKPWPSEVQINGEPAVVVGRPGGPAVKVEAGAHIVRMTLDWSRPPDFVLLPPDVGLVSLVRGGEAVEAPRLDEAGRLWLSETSAAQAGTDGGETARVSVYRRLRDGVPLAVDTRVVLAVSGRARELTLPGMVLPGAKVVNIDSKLPVRVSPEGEVRVFARAGSHDVVIATLLAAPPERIEVPPRAADGSGVEAFEVWAWFPDEAVRAAELSGLTAIDPASTSLPPDWHGGSTFAARPGEVLQIATSRRGEPEPPPNRLMLQRDIWLDLGGGGFTVRDELTGEMRRQWRLDYGPEGQLGRVHDAGAGEDLLITGGQGGAAGVEVRATRVYLQAETRLEGALRTLPAVGWDAEVSSLSARLHLPPGWTLLAAGGVDSAPGTWFGAWTLFDVFVLLVLGAATGKVLGWRWGLVAGLGVALSHEQPDAPLWIWFHVLASLALLRAIQKPGRWQQLASLYHFGAFLVLLVLLFPYVREQLHGAIHPQAAESVWGFDYWGGGEQNKAPMMPTTAEMEPMDWEQEESSNVGSDYVQSASPQSPRAAIQKLSRAGKLDEKAALLNLQQLDPKAVVQTGPGLPTWNWSTRSLSWSGRVGREQMLDLWLLSPIHNAILAVLRVLAFLLLALAFAVPGRSGTSGDSQIGVWAGLRRHAGSLLAGLSAAILATSAAAPNATATEEEPSAMPSVAAPAQPTQRQESAPAARGDVHFKAPVVALPSDWGRWLDAWAARKAESLQCEGRCAVAIGAALTVLGNDVEVIFDVSAQHPSAFTLPRLSEGAWLQDVVVGGAAASLRRTSGGFLQARVQAGSSKVTLRARWLRGDALGLQFESTYRPGRLVVSGEGLTVDGINEWGAPDVSVEVRRAKADTPSPEASQELAPWFTIRRQLMLGLPWSVRTEVARTKTEKPALFRLPLLPGEAVTTDGVRVEGGMALVSLGAGHASAWVESELQVSETLVLTMPQDPTASEEWYVECSQIWGCEFSGPPPVATLSDEGRFRPMWLPQPGEKLEVAVHRPQGAPGAASTITSVDYRLEPSHRQLSATLRLEVRASQGGRHRVGLPPEAELEEVIIDGAARALRADDDGKISLPLRPGAQIFELRWNQPWSFRLLHQAPPVDLGAPAANVSVQFSFGSADWVLAAMGPAWGPAVRFWSHLLSLLLLGLLLGRLRQLPLKSSHWLIFSLGFTQVPAAALLAAAVWFGALALRRHRPASSAIVFNFWQLVLIGGTAAFLSLLFTVVGYNLLASIDMQISGAASSNFHLRWYVDRLDAGAFPAATAVVAPALIWRGLMLVWSLWLALQVVRWLKWGWESLSAGELWRPIIRQRKEGPSE